jgi:predicted ATPase
VSPVLQGDDASVRLTLGSRTVDLGTRRVEGPDVGLAPAEVALLTRLAAAGGDVVPTEELRVLVGAASENAFSRAVVRLRAKLEEDPRSPRHLLTLRGEGLALRVDRPTLAIPAAGWLERVALVQRVQALLATPGLLTLLGPGGAGKTTLARAAVAGRPDALFCELVSARTAEDVWRILAGCAAEAVPGDVRGVGGLARALARRGPLVVVLDNAEQVVAAVASTVEVLLAGAPALRLLVTSRVPLGTATERRLEVPLLDPDEAAALYALRTGHAVEPELRELLAEVERLPLVVELFATHARALTPRRLREVYRERALALPTATHAPERQQTLGHTLQWSFDLLAQEARGALVRLAVLSAPVPLALAEALVGGAEPLDQLQVLVDAGLVSARGGRIALLDLVRRFAGEQLGAEVRAEAVASAVRWALGYLANPPPGTVRAPTDELTVLWEVFVAAEGSPDVAPVARWLVRTRRFGSRDRVRLAACALSGAEGAARIPLLTERAEAARYSGDEETAARDLDEALGLGPTEAQQLQLLVERAHLRRHRLDYRGAERDLRAAAAVRDEPRAVYALASLLAYEGRFTDAAEVVRANDALLGGSPYDLPARSLAALTTARVAPDDALASLAALRERAAREPVTAETRVAFVDAYCGEVLATAGRYPEADASYRAAEQVLERLQHTVPLSEVRCKRAWLLARSGEVDAGRALLEAVLAGAEGYLVRLGSAWLAVLEARAGRFAESRAARQHVGSDGTEWSQLTVLVRVATALEARAEGEPAAWEALRAEALRRPWPVLPPGY